MKLSQDIVPNSTLVITALSRQIVLRNFVYAAEAVPRLTSVTATVVLINLNRGITMCS